jgi:hypothetical protein
MTVYVTELGKLTTPARYQAERETCFPSGTSLQWFIRTNRDKLVEGGALVQIAGRLLVHPDKFDAVALAVGREKVAA